MARVYDTARVGWGRATGSGARAKLCWSALGIESRFRAFSKGVGDIGASGRRTFLRLGGGEGDVELIEMMVAALNVRFRSLEGSVIARNDREMSWDVLPVILGRDEDEEAIGCEDEEAIVCEDKEVIGCEDEDEIDCDKEGIDILDWDNEGGGGLGTRCPGALHPPSSRQCWRQR